MSTLKGVVRTLREREAAGPARSSLASWSPPDRVDMEVAAVDAGALPPLHDGFAIDEAGEPLDLLGSRMLFTGVPAVGGATFAVGSKVTVRRLANGFWRIEGGSGSSGGGSASGGVLPHSHTGGGDGPRLGILGTL